MGVQKVKTYSILTKCFVAPDKIITTIIETLTVSTFLPSRFQYLVHVTIKKEMHRRLCPIRRRQRGSLGGGRKDTIPLRKTKSRAKLCTGILTSF